MCLGIPQTIEQQAKASNLSLDGIGVLDPTTSDKAPAYAKAFYELRKHKGMTLEEAKEKVRDPLCYANMMVRLGDAEGSVAGAVYTTSDVVRSAIQQIGVKKDAQIVSSFFLMMLCEPFHSLKGGLIFSDCGLVIDPTEEELADIALAAADSGRHRTSCTYNHAGGLSGILPRSGTMLRACVLTHCGSCASRASPSAKCAERHRCYTPLQSCAQRARCKALPHLL